MGMKRNACRILVVKPGGKRPLGRPRRRWADNIKMDLREIGWDNNIAAMLTFPIVFGLTVINH
jgi:hypothetical protein